MTKIKIIDKVVTSFLTFRHLIGVLSCFDGSKIKWLNKEPRFEEKEIQLEKAEKEIEEILTDEIKKLENREIAVVLSGGIDSSLILALCRTVFPGKKIHVYTAGFYGNKKETIKEIFITNSIKHIRKKLLKANLCFPACTRCYWWQQGIIEGI